MIFEKQKNQIAFWESALHFTESKIFTDDGYILIKTSNSACFNNIIKKHTLHNGILGVFKEAVDYEYNHPRISVLYYINRKPIAYSLMMPAIRSWSYDEGKDDIGLLGVFVKPDFRNKGYAKKVLSGISKIVDNVKKETKLAPFSIACESKIINICKPIFSVPFIPRWEYERSDSEFFIEDYDDFSFDFNKWIEKIDVLV